MSSFGEHLHPVAASQPMAASSSAGPSQVPSLPPFCTTACLLGLRSGGPLDVRCPNSAQHSTTRLHVITEEVAMHILYHLFSSGSIGDGIWYFDERLPIDIFRATLPVYGYTVVVKAGRNVDKERLQTESRVYRRLLPLQGTDVPVCFGYFEAAKYLSSNDPVNHMLVLCYAGERIDGGPLYDPEKSDSTIMSDLPQLRPILDRIEEVTGIQHDDVAWRNVLWNEELKRYVVIDFEAVKETHN